jgi:sulfate adenylyltransferase
MTISFWGRRCGAMATAKTCPHPQGEQVALSGTQLRACWRPVSRPPEFSRAEVAQLLIDAYRS